VAACGGLFLHPGDEIQTLTAGDPRYRHAGIDGLSDRVNIQWFRHESAEIIPVEHLTANILFNREWLERVGGFETGLYRVHRDETQATWRLFVEGATLYVEPKAVAWHLRGTTGGARGHPPEVYLEDHRRFMAQRKTMKPGIHIGLGHGIGDGFMATPMLSAMRRMNPGRAIAVYAPWARDVLAGNPDVDEIATHPLDAQRTIRLEQSVYAWASANRFQGHLAEAYCRMFDLPLPDDMAPRLFLEGAPRQSALPESLVGHRYVAIAPWSSAKTYDLYQPSSTKNWPMNRWSSVLDWAGQRGLKVVQLRGSPEEPLVPGVDVDLCGRPLSEVFSCIEQARLLVSVDTMAHHAAAASGVPSVVLWGRSRWQNFGYEKDSIMNLQGECPGVAVHVPRRGNGDSRSVPESVHQDRPCINGDQWAMDRTTCPIEGHPCMSSITEEMVIDAMERLVEMHG
jgi:ADP-heptose:LPS heptosyltransferase